MFLISAGNSRNIVNPVVLTGDALYFNVPGIKAGSVREISEMGW
jgi:hypothetical protein